MKLLGAREKSLKLAGGPRCGLSDESMKSGRSCFRLFNFCAHHCLANGSAKCCATADDLSYERAGARKHYELRFLRVCLPARPRPSWSAPPIGLAFCQPHSSTDRSLARLSPTGASFFQTVLVVLITLCLEAMARHV